MIGGLGKLVRTELSFLLRRDFQCMRRTWISFKSPMWFPNRETCVHQRGNHFTSHLVYFRGNVLEMVSTPRETIFAMSDLHGFQ